MRSKERCLMALRHQEPDRVPMNYHADLGMSERLKNHFGITGDERRQCWLTSNEDPRLLKALDCDLRTLVPEYVGPPIQNNPDGSFTAMFGEHLKGQKNEDGSEYFLNPYLPLAEATTMADVEAHRWPSADWFDFSSIRDQIDEFEDYAIVGGDMGTLDCMNRCLMLFGYERVLLMMAEHDPLLLRAFEHISDFYYDYLTRLFEAGGGKINIAYFGEDLGTQNAPRISVAMYKDLIVPLWERHVQLAKKHGCFIMQHSCGSTRAFYPEMIRLGIDVHDTVQPEAGNMNHAELKREFGDKLCFHGGISIQQVLQTGTVAEVVAEVRRTLDALAPGGGYIFAPTHWIQSGTPIENVLAMYQEAKEYSAELYRRK